MTDDLQTAPAPREGSAWAWVPALLLGSMLVGLGVMAYVAIDDPHFALEPDYYDKAVHWDRSQAEARASASTGLHLQLGSLVTAADGGVEVEVHVVDRATSPFAGAQVELEAFPNAYAERIQKLSLRETAPGVYAGKLARGVLGLWELRFDVVREGVRFREVRRADVVKGGAA